MVFFTRRSSSEQEFEIVFKRNYRELCLLASKLLKSLEDAQDVVNDVFEYTWKNYSQLKKETLDAYLYTAVRNRCYNFLEHQKVINKFSALASDLVEGQDGSPEEYEVMLQQIESVCNELPEKTRYVLSQCYYHRKKYKEVAEEMHISTDAVKKHIVKALKVLRESVNRTK